MQRIWYANGQFLTDDRIADALMDYARVLAIIDSADVVRLPGLDIEGNIREIQLIIGPASQILAMATDEPQRDMDAETIVAQMRQRAEQKLPNAVGAIGAGLPPSDPEATDEGNRPLAESER